MEVEPKGAIRKVSDWITPKNIRFILYIVAVIILIIGLAIKFSLRVTNCTHCAEPILSIHPKWVDSNRPYHIECIQPSTTNKSSTFRTNLEHLQKNPIFIDYFVVLWYNLDQAELNLLYQIIVGMFSKIKEHGLHGHYPAVDLGLIAYKENNTELLTFICCRCLALQDLHSLYIQLGDDVKKKINSFLTNNQKMFLASKMKSISQITREIPECLQLEENLFHAAKKMKNTPLVLDICSLYYKKQTHESNGVKTFLVPSDFDKFSICEAFLLSTDEIEPNYAELVAFIANENNYQNLVETFCMLKDDILFPIFDALLQQNKKYIILDILILFLNQKNSFTRDHAKRIVRLFTPEQIIQNRPLFIRYLLRLTNDKIFIFDLFRDYFWNQKEQILLFTNGNILFEDAVERKTVGQDNINEILFSMESSCTLHNVPILRCAACLDEKVNYLKQSLRKQQFLDFMVLLFPKIGLKSAELIEFCKQLIDTDDLFPALIGSGNYKSVFILLIYYALIDTEPVQPELKKILLGQHRKYTNEGKQFLLWEQIAKSIKEVFGGKKNFKIDFSVGIQQFGDKFASDDFYALVKSSHTYYSSVPFVDLCLKNKKNLTAIRLCKFISNPSTIARAVFETFPKYDIILVDVLKECPFHLASDFVCEIAKFKSQKLFDFVFNILVDRKLDEKKKCPLKPKNRYEDYLPKVWYLKKSVEAILACFDTIKSHIMDLFSIIDIAFAANCFTDSLEQASDVYFLYLTHNPKFVSMKFLLNKEVFEYMLVKTFSKKFIIPESIFSLPTPLPSSKNLFDTFKDIINTCLSHFLESEDFFIRFFCDKLLLKNEITNNFTSLYLGENQLKTIVNSSELYKYDLGFLNHAKIQLIVPVLKSSDITFQALRELYNRKHPDCGVVRSSPHRKEVLKLITAEYCKEINLIPKFEKVKHEVDYFKDPKTDPKKILSLVAKRNIRIRILEYFEMFFAQGRQELPYADAIAAITSKSIVELNPPDEKKLLNLLLNAYTDAFIRRDITNFIPHCLLPLRNFLTSSINDFDVSIMKGSEFKSVFLLLFKHHPTAILIRESLFNVFLNKFYDPHLMEEMIIIDEFRSCTNSTLICKLLAKLGLLPPKPFDLTPIQSKICSFDPKELSDKNFKGVFTFLVAYRTFLTDIVGIGNFILKDFVRYLRLVNDKEVYELYTKCLLNTSVAGAHLKDKHQDLLFSIIKKMAGEFNSFFKLSFWKSSAHCLSSYEYNILNDFLKVTLKWYENEEIVRNLNSCTLDNLRIAFKDIDSSLLKEADKRYTETNRISTKLFGKSKFFKIMNERVA